MAVYKSGKDYSQQKIIERFNKILSENKPFQIAVYNDLARKSVRIFEDGKASDGSLIGTYATKPPMYINPNFAPRKGTISIAGGGKLQGLLPTRGKPSAKNPDGEHTFTAATAWHGVPGTKAGDIHRTTYLQGGYKELRNRTGRRIDRVNLRFTNDLFLDWANSARVSSRPTPTKVNQHKYIIKLKRGYNAGKVKGLEIKYGKIFNSTKQERSEFFKSLQINFTKFMNGEDVS